MLLVRAPIACLWWSLRPISPNVSRRWFFPVKFYSISHPLVSSTCLSDGQCDDFLPWLERKAGSTISSLLRIGKSSYGRCLIASNVIKTGECILKVPYDVQITPDNLLQELKSLVPGEIGNVTRLAIVILAEQKICQDSEWDPYIRCLPQLGELHNTIFWDESELEIICQSSVYQETIKLKSQIEKNFSAVRPVFESHPEIFGHVMYKDFMHACTLVGSRAWGSSKGLSLIPFADFLNHDWAAEAIVLSDDDKQCSEVLADRDYAPGEQVFINYGKFSNATLMLDFGFTLPYNSHDQVQIQVDIPQNDFLRGKKMELLQRHFIPAIEDVNGFKPSVDCFTIKEVRSIGGKGKGLPQSLRAFARVLSQTSSQELANLATEAAQSDGRLGRHPLNNINKEIEAHEMLSSLIIQLIDERTATIKSLDTADSVSIHENAEVSIRRQMAIDLLNGEVRILKSASAWLKNYCANLTTRKMDECERNTAK